jgi:transaldolase
VAPTATSPGKSTPPWPGARTAPSRRCDGCTKSSAAQCAPKIPATEAGIVAIEESIALGHSINVTLIFSLERYAAVVEAYLRGLRRAADAGRDLTTIHSVASFFISRLDTAADRLLEQDAPRSALKLRGQLGIASAKLAYQHFQEAFHGPRWEALRAYGATPQRPCGRPPRPKMPRYRDVRYVEELIGPGTITTLPEPTLVAFEDHGRVKPPCHGASMPRGRTFDALASAGIDLRRLTDELERDGIARFRDSYANVIASLPRADAREPRDMRCASSSSPATPSPRRMPSTCSAATPRAQSRSRHTVASRRVNSVFGSPISTSIWPWSRVSADTGNRRARA